MLLTIILLQFFCFFWAVTQWKLACIAHGWGELTSMTPVPDVHTTQLLPWPLRGLGLLEEGPTIPLPLPIPLLDSWDSARLQRPSQSLGPLSCPEELRVIKQKSHKCLCILLALLPACRSIISGLWTTYPGCCWSPRCPIGLSLPPPPGDQRQKPEVPWRMVLANAGSKRRSRQPRAHGAGWGAGGPGRCGWCCRHQRGTAS